MLQPSLARRFSMRSILLISSIVLCTVAVKPVWRTPVTNVRKNATSRTHRASNSVPHEGYVPSAGLKQSPYYTRPEDFKIPDYRPAKANGFLPNFQQPQQFIPQRQFPPQYPQLYPQQQQQQQQRQQYFQGFRPPIPGNGFVQQPFRYPPYQNGPQQFPNGNFFQPPRPVYPPPVSDDNNNNININRNIPPNAVPYWEGAGPIPPQGAYGPTQSTTQPAKPSVNPETYHGTIPREPSVNPEQLTTSTAQRESAEAEFTRGWYNPTSTSPKGFFGTPTTSVSDHSNETTAIFEMGTNPFSSSPGSSTTSLASSPETSAATQSTQPYVEDITKEFFTEGPTPPPRVSPFTDVETHSTSSETEATTSSTATSPTSTDAPAVTPEIPEDFEDHSEYFPEEAVTKTLTASTTVEQTKSSYFPRPVSTQAYQPPGHLPEDFSEHIDVNFLKPNRSCIGPLCGVDSDKVSLYKPETGGEVGRRPTLLISNAAKGDAARLGYIPPPPKPISDFTGPPQSTKYYNQKFQPGYRPGGPGGFEGDITTIEPFHPEIPSGPHVFMPPQNFPAPPSPTLVPPALQSMETAHAASFSPTAKTIATTTPYEYYTTTPSTPASSPVTVPFTAFETTRPPFNTLPQFESTPLFSETQPSPPTPYETPPEVPSFPSTEGTPSPWSPTYKTVATPSRGPTTSAGASTTRRSFETTTTIALTATVPTTVFVPAETVTTTRPRVTEYETPGTTGPLYTTTSSAPSSPAATQERFTPPQGTSTPSGETPATRSREFSTTPSRETPQTTTSSGESPSTPSRDTLTTPSRGETPPSSPSYSSQPPTRAGGLQTTTTKSVVQNRVRGKVHVVCKEDGIEFSATTLFPLTGQIFASERKRIPSCLFDIVNQVSPKVFLPFTECGVKNAGELTDNRAQYHMQVVVVIQQADGSSTIQSFMAQCVHQKILYNKQTLPRRIEEALEELKLVATKLEQKAPLPQVEMKIVVDEHHQLGPEVSEVDIGMPLAVQWRLIPESDAYGFHVKNCVVKDDISGIEHKMIDELGCSTDLSIFAHPHYDTYHDTASSHIWAFKVPDHTRLRIRCDVAICSDIPSSTTNISSCATIPSPPFCPDLITSPANSILFDAEGAFLKRRRQVGRHETQSVRAALCTGSNCDLRPIGLEKRCFDLRWVAASTGFSLATLIAAIFIHIAVRAKIAKQRS